MKQIIGRKIGLIKIFDEKGIEYPGTVIEVLPNVVMQIKTKEKDGYNAYVIGYGNNTKPSRCEYGRAKINKQDENSKDVYVPDFYKEIYGDELEKMNLSVSSVLNASLFKAGEHVDIIGVSKGKGYTGAIKRYNFHLGRSSHGSGYHRGVGSFANNGRTNNRVMPGKKMAGRSGGEQTTIFNELILESNPDKNFILVKGSLPGNMFSVVKIRSTIKQNVKNKPISKMIDLSI